MIEIFIAPYCGFAKHSLRDTLKSRDQLNGPWFLAGET